MIIFANDVVGLKILQYLKKKDYDNIEKIVIIKKSNQINDYVNINYKDKVLYWKKSNQLKLVSILKKTKSKVIFLAWWPFILDKKFLNIKQYVLNTHPSYLPYYKGKDPNFWSIIGGGPYGVTINHVNSKIDSGNIAFQSSIKNINWTYDAKKLYDQTIIQMIFLFKKNYKYIKKLKIPSIKQNPKYNKINYRKDMINKSKIKLSKKMKFKDFINLLRAKNFEPNNGIIFEDKKKLYSINIKIKKI